MSQVAALRRAIRFRDLVLFYVVSGLSVRWAAAAAAAGPSIFVVWVAALTCFFVPLAACVMELSSRHPDEGGLYVWTREAFGDFSGFIAAWTYWMSNLPYFPGVLYFGAASTLFAFGARAQSHSGNPVYYVAFAVTWLTVITLLNIRGVNAGKWLNNISALGALVPLGILLLLAIASLVRFGPVDHYPAASFVPHLTIDNAVFWSGVFFAFGGVEAGSAMGDEIENPRRVIPWAILVGGTILTIGYIGGTAALLVALPTDAVRGPEGFINGIRALSAHLGIDWLLPPVALLVGLNAVGGAAAFLSSTSRLPFVAGIDRYLPSTFGSVHTRFRTPWVAIAVYGLAGIIVTLLGQAGTSVRGAYEVLVSMGIISYFLPYVFLFAAMIRLQSQPVGAEVRRVPGGKPMAIALASVGLASTALTIVLSAFPANDEPNKMQAVAKIIGGTVVLVGAGVVVFLTQRRRAQARVTRLEQSL
jgi:amino acid transporter